VLTKIPAVLATLALGSGVAAVSYTTVRGGRPAEAAPTSTPAPTLTQQACPAPGQIVSGGCVVVVRDRTLTAPAATEGPTSGAPNRATDDATHDSSGRDHAEGGDDHGGRRDGGSGSESSGRDHAEDN
jgi:hypothetical protein